MAFFIKFMLMAAFALVLLIAFLSLFGGAGLWVFLLVGAALLLAPARPPRP